MRPIYNTQEYMHLGLLNNTIEGTTENLTIKGAEIENIVTGEYKQINSSTYGCLIDPNKFEEGKWTVIFKVESQFTAGELGVTLGKAGSGSRGLKGEVHVNNTKLKNGYIKTVIDVTKRNDEQIQEYSIHFWAWSSLVPPISEWQISDVMVIKGEWEHYDIPYFEDKLGLNGHISLISHNKNVFTNYVKNNTLFQKDSPTGLYPQGNQRYLSYFIPVEHSMEYNFSFKRLKNFSGSNNRCRLYMYNTEPKEGVVHTTKIEHDTKTSINFTTQSDTKYIMLYLGFESTTKNLNYDEYVTHLQLEPGTVKTSYEAPAFYDYTFELPRDLHADDYLVYDPDYKFMVIKNKKSQDNYEVVATTNLYGLYFDTFNDKTWFAIESSHPFLNGSIKFDYPIKLPTVSSPLLKGKQRLFILKSGDVIDTRLYKNVKESNNGVTIELSDSYFNDPDKIIFVNDITRVIVL